MNDRAIVLGEDRQVYRQGGGLLLQIAPGLGNLATKERRPVGRQRSFQKNAQVQPFAVSAIAGAVFCSSAAAGTWNAYALDMKGTFGYAVGAETEDEAKSTALDRCGERACEVIVSAESKCIAVAHTFSDGYW